MHSGVKKRQTDVIVFILHLIIIKITINAEVWKLPKSRNHCIFLNHVSS